MIAARQTILFAAVAVAGISACSGGSGTSNVPRALPAAASPTPGVPGTSKAASGSVRLSLVIPSPVRSSSHRRPAYVSPATNSLTFSQQGGPAQTISLAASSPNCSTDSGNRTCTVNLNATAGDDQTFTLALFASTDGSGTPLSAQSIVRTIFAGTTNPITATLNGVVSSLSLALADATLPYGQPGSTNVVVNAQDASGNTIVGPGVYADVDGNPITVTLTDSDTSGSTSLEQSTVTGPATIALTYTGGALANATISASTASLSTSTSAELAFVCGAPPDSSDLYFVGNLSGSAAAGGNAFAELPIDTFGSATGPANVVDESGVSFVSIDNRGYPYGFGSTGGTYFASEYCPSETGTAPPYRSFSIPLGPSSASASEVSDFAVDTADEVFAMVVNLPGMTTGPDFIEKFAADSGSPGLPTGVAPSPIATISGPNTQLLDAGALAAGSDGNVYAGNLGQITEYPSSAGGNVAPSSTYAYTAGGLLGVTDVTSDASGNVYALYQNDNLAEIDPSITFGAPAVVEYAYGSYATPLRVISGSNTQLGTYMGMAYPSSQALRLTLDPSGTIYVLNTAEDSSSTVYFDVESFGAAATGNVAPDSTFSVSGVRDRALAVSAGGQVAIGDQYGYGILLYNTAGTYQGEIAVDGQIGLIYGVAFDASGNLYASSQQYTSSGGATYGTSGILTFTAPVTYSSAPSTVDPTSASYQTLVVDSGGAVHGTLASDASIDTYTAGDTSGMPASSFSIASYPSDASTHGLGLDTNGNAYSANSENGVVVAPASSTGTVAPSAVYSDLQPSTIYPEVAVDANGDVYSASCTTDSVAIFSPGQSVGPPTGAIIGNKTLLDCPKSVAVDGAGDIFVLTYSQVLMFAPGATGNVAPTASFSFSAGEALSSIAVGPGFASMSPSFKARVARRASLASFTLQRGPVRARSKTVPTCAAPLRRLIAGDRHATRVVPVKPGFLINGSCFTTNAGTHVDPRMHVER